MHAGDVIERVHIGDGFGETDTGAEEYRPVDRSRQIRSLERRPVAIADVAGIVIGSLSEEIDNGAGVVLTVDLYAFAGAEPVQDDVVEDCPVAARGYAENHVDVDAAGVQTGADRIDDVGAVGGGRCRRLDVENNQRKGWILNGEVMHAIKPVQE